MQDSYAGWMATARRQRRARHDPRSLIGEDAHALDLEVLRVAGDDRRIDEPGHAGDDRVTELARAGSAQPASRSSGPSGRIRVGRDVLESVDQPEDRTDFVVIEAGCRLRDDSVADHQVIRFAEQLPDDGDRAGSSLRVVDQ